MKYTAFRIVSFATKNFVRNIGLSLMTVTILVLALLSINTLIVVKSLTNAGVQAFEDQVDVSIVFHVDADDSVVQEVVSTVQSLPQVREASYASPEEEKIKFADRHKDDENIIASLEALDENPFGATLTIQASKSGDYERILEIIDTDKFNEVIEQKSFGEHEELVKRLDLLTKRATNIGTFFTILFSLFAFFIIFNTIRVTLYTQREEIGIMRLVGASKWFIRAPIYMEAFYYVTIAVLVSIILTIVVADVIDPYVQQMFSSTGFSLLADIRRNMAPIVIGEFVGVFVLTLLSAHIAMHKYLKV